MRRLSVVPVVVLLAAALLPSAPALADPFEEPGTPLPLDYVGDVLHHPASGRTLVTDGERILFLEPDGQVAGTLTGMTGADELTALPDGRVLVALEHEDAIAAIDPHTMTADVRPTGEGSCPVDVVEAQGLWWFSSGGCRPRGYLSSFDPATGTVAADLKEWSPGALLETTPSWPDRVYALADWGLHAIEVRGLPQPAAESVAYVDDAGEADLTISPNGATVAVPSDDVVRRYDTDRLFSRPTLSLPSWDGSLGYEVAFRDDGMVAVAGRESVGSGRTWVFHPGDREPFRTYRYDERRNAALAFAGDRLVSLTVDGRGAHHRVFPPRMDSRVSMRGPTFVAYGGEARVLVRLAAPEGAPRRVRVYAEPADGRRTRVATVSVPPGEWVTVRHRVTRNTVFEAVYAGSADVEDSRAERSYDVPASADTRLLHEVGRDGRYHLVPASGRALFQTVVRPDHAGHRITYYLEYLAGGAGWRALGSARVRLDRRSSARVQLRGRPGLVGVPLRLHASGKGAPSSSGIHGNLVYFRFRA